MYITGLLVLTLPFIRLGSPSTSNGVGRFQTSPNELPIHGGGFQTTTRKWWLKGIQASTKDRQDICVSHRFRIVNLNTVREDILFGFRVNLIGIDTRLSLSRGFRLDSKKAQLVEIVGHIAV